MLQSLCWPSGTALQLLRGGRRAPDSWHLVPRRHTANIVDDVCWQTALEKGG